ncbi:MAG TPA: rod shape-determining protein MreC [bacterium]|nr:rod shape-determining protein MreC [bacterium]
MGILFSLFIMGKSKHVNVKSTENANKVEEKLNYEELVAENIRLRNILGIKEKESYFSRFAVGNVLSLRPHVFPVEIVISKGAAQGIREGMSVVSMDLSLVGRVSEVQKNTSKVVTVFNTMSRVSVIVDSTNEVGIMEGGSVPYCLLKYISRESKIKKGDSVQTSGYSDFHPKGIKVGEIVEVVKAQDSLFFDIHIKPYSCVSQMEEVLIGE